ncbi:hypothetical protein B0H10DRAFT_1963773 [Mycena sp. CBHHK59/15]|nr:hypothetical protein B0H10DRAFT_1963773 [Mycena sp. CBHHK59/15]
MASIDDLPPELLYAILERASLRAAVNLSHVSRFWRECCISYTELWCMIRVCNTDLKHVDVFRAFFDRSKEQPICLVMDFSVPVTDRIEFRCFMVLVASHIERCHQIWICASPVNYYTMINLFSDKKYPEPYCIHLDIPTNYTMTQGWHDDQDALLPWFHVFHIQLTSNAVEEVRGPNLPLNPWFLCGPKQLAFHNIRIPFFDQTNATQPIDFLFPYSITDLALSNLIASEGSDGDELDCSPFFRALETPNLRRLRLDGMEISERVWNDFIAALPSTPRYPFLTELMFRDMHIWPMDPFVSLLRSTPALITLVFLECSPGSKLPLWDVIAEKSLCPSLKEIKVDRASVAWSLLRNLSSSGRQAAFFDVEFARFDVDIYKLHLE